ncbi:MAG: hypothetical protein AB8B64_26940 [Granulosicoccus sp.]
MSNANNMETLYGASAPTYQVGIRAVFAGNQANIGKAMPKTSALFGQTVSAFVFELKPSLAAGEVPDFPKRALPYFEEVQSV